MHRSARFITLCLAALVSTPSAGAAATTFGSVSGTYTADSDADEAAVVQLDASFAAPTNGVVTSVSARVNAGTVGIGLVRGLPPATTTAIDVVELTGAAGSPVISKATRIPVKAGDRLAMDQRGAGQVRYLISPSSTATIHPGLLPAIGVALPAPTITTTAQLAIAATLEPDADGDGYGDETQDGCPLLATAQAPPCAVDLVTSGAVSASAPAGVPAIVTANVGATAAGPGSNVKVTVGVPSGIEALAVSVGGGTCEGSTCTIPSLPAGATRQITAVLRGQTPGTAPITFTSTAPATTGNLGDDATTATFTVTAPPAVSAPVKLCTVPKLRGLTRAGASSKLIAAGCVLGKATGSKRKKAKVRSQTIPVGTKVLAGSKVGVRLG